MTTKYGKLILVTPDQPDQEFILTQALTTIGSAETNDIVIKQSKLSRAHARIESSEQGCMIFDLESSTGTQVNNRRIKHSNLVSGDMLKLGEAELRFEADSTLADTEATILDVAVFAEGDPERVEAAEPSPLQAKNALVKLQAGKGKSPFFCVTARYSDLPLFRNLALHLGPNQPFYALQPPQPTANSPFLTNLEALAAHYVEEIRRTQPNGPYYLGGYSIGGLVAFEMAQQIQAGGAEVALLALIDTPYLDRNPLPYWNYRSAQTLKQANDTLLQPLQKLVPSLVQQVEKSAQSVLNTLQGKPFPPVVGQVAQQVEEDFQTLQEALEDEGCQATLKVTQGYRPKAYSGKMTLLLAAQSMVRYSDALWQWHRIAPNGLDVHTIPGSYIGILKEPQVQKLAGQLKAYLAD
jgi:thioesterase domain-containing protein